MNKELLLELLKQEINDLQKIAGQFDHNFNIHPLELVLCTNKLKSVTEVLELLAELEKISSNHPKNINKNNQTEEKKQAEIIEEERKKQEAREAAERASEIAREENRKREIALEEERRKQEAREAAERASEIAREENRKREIALEEEQKKQDAREAAERASEIAREENRKREIALEEERRKEFIPPQSTIKKGGKVLGEELVGNKKSLFDLLGENKDSNDLASQLKSGKLEDINKGIPLNDKIWFTKELFGGDSHRYQSCITKLNSLKSIEEALDYLNLQFEWDIESKSVQKFLRIVNRRYQ
jgi:hypothetical protein